MTTHSVGRRRRRREPTRQVREIAFSRQGVVAWAPSDLRFWCSHVPVGPPERQKPRRRGASRSTATGIRTPVSAVRGRRPSPLDDGGSGRHEGSNPSAILGASLRADVAELVDAHGSGPCGSNPVEVRVLSSASRRKPRSGGAFSFWRRCDVNRGGPDGGLTRAHFQGGFARDYPPGV
jgi:hypothetical protein